jgi:sRNA-binding carbon storage regulator CsrA
MDPTNHGGLTMHRHYGPKHRAEDYRSASPDAGRPAGPGARNHWPRTPGLTLARSDRQEIRILLPDGEAIVITLVEGKPGRARLHIAAPRNLKILRGELGPSASSGPGSEQQQMRA